VDSGPWTVGEGGREKGEGEGEKKEEVLFIYNI
jgi:hypothetical protein